MLIIFNRISQLSESGIYEHQIEKSLRPKGYGENIVKPIREELNFEPLSLMQMKGVFIFLLIGHSLAIIVFFIEVYVGKYVNRADQILPIYDVYLN